MERIYLIEDINGLKYVGRTKKKLNIRISEHKHDKKRNHNCSSEKLDLDKCTISCLDIAESPQEAHELEKFYINSIECVNDRKLNFDRKEYQKEYYKEYSKEYNKQYYEINKDKEKQRKKNYHEKNKDEINRKRRERRAKLKLMNTAE